MMLQERTDTRGKVGMPDAMSVTPELLQELLAESAALHRHLCPRQVLGVRLGRAGLRALGMITDGATRFPNSEKMLLTIVETDGCGADGIAVATDCWVGRRTLRVLDFGKMAATLVDRCSGQVVRVWPSAQARQLALDYAADARSRWHAYLEAYQVIPDEELLEVEPVQLTVSVEELLSKPEARTVCEKCGEEIINERERLVEGRIVCRSCAGESYYRLR